MTYAIYLTTICDCGEPLAIVAGMHEGGHHGLLPCLQLAEFNGDHPCDLSLSRLNDITAPLVDGHVR